MVWQELVNSGQLSPSDFVRVTSTAAAQIFNIYPRKGVIAPGSDADVILFDPLLEHSIAAATHHSAMDTNIYQGYRLKGKVRGLQQVLGMPSKLNNHAADGGSINLPLA